jgi:hypothetical protein
MLFALLRTSITGKGPLKPRDELWISVSADGDGGKQLNLRIKRPDRSEHIVVIGKLPPDQERSSAKVTL